MSIRNPAPAGLSQLKDLVMNLQTRVEGLIASGKRSEERIEALETELDGTRELAHDLQMHCVALQLQLDDVHAHTEDLVLAEELRAARGESSSSSSSNESETSLFNRLGDYERQVKSAMRDPGLKHVIRAAFCRKMDIPKLHAACLPPYTEQSTAAENGPGTDDASEDQPLRFNWALPENDDVNNKAINALTTYILARGSDLSIRAARPIFIVKRDGVKELVKKKFKALAKSYNDHQLVQEHERRTDELMQQADARMNGEDGSTPPGDAPMDVDTVQDGRAKKIKERAERKIGVAKKQTAQKYAARYRNILRKYLPPGDDAGKPENDGVFIYQTQSPWVSDDDATNVAGKKVKTRTWESEAFKAMKRLEDRTDIKVTDPVDGKKLRNMKRARRVPVTAGDQSDSDDVPRIQKTAQRVQLWMVDADFLERHPDATMHLNQAQASTGAPPHAAAKWTSQV